MSYNEYRTIGPSLPGFGIDIQTVSTADAVAMARRAAREEGIFSGPSTGANLIVALRLAERLGPGKRMGTTQVDSGLKYLAGEVYGAG